MLSLKPAIPVRCLACKIRGVGICRALSVEEIARLSSMASHKSYRAGQTIRMEGEKIDFYANVISGVAKKVKSTHDGREQIVGLLFAGDLLDQIFFDTSPCSIEAVSELTLCNYPKTPFETMIRNDTDIEFRLFRRALEELNEAQDWMLLLGRKTARERVASFLLLLIRRHLLVDCPHAAVQADVKVDPDADIIIPIPVSRSVMADYLGLTTETVCRQMTHLRHDGIILLPDNHSFTLIDDCRLEEAAGE